MQKFAVNSEYLWLIDYESSHWCGGQSHVVVRAANTSEAVLKAEDHMQSEMSELFSDEDEEAHEECEYVDECAFTVNSVELFDESHEQWEFYMDPVQRDNFYPTIE